MNAGATATAPVAGAPHVAPGAPGPGGHPWVRGPISAAPFLIVAGTYRSGTTSLYTYLAGHPQVAASSVKEPAFFFSERYRQARPAYPPGHEVEAYLSLFKPKPDARVWLEATPNYLHDPGCAERIRYALPEARIVVVLRDPVERIVSWYKHVRLQGWLPEDLPIGDWVARQLAAPAAPAGYVDLALGHGRYAADLARYIEVFGRERVLVLWFDALERDPRAAMRRVAAFAGLDPAYFDAYDFQPQNSAMEFKHRAWFTRYLRLRRLLGAPVRRFPRLRFRIKELLNAIEPWYVRLLTRPARAVGLTDAQRAALRAYYRDDAAALARLTGEAVPWSGEAPATCPGEAPATCSGDAPEPQDRP